jgi:AcrR family transcriptional regulator
MTTSEKTDGTKPYHHGDLKEACLREGLAMLPEVGMDQFSLRAVARRLGVTPTALYHHFPNKEILLREMGRVVTHEFVGKLRAATSGASTPAESMMQMGLVYLEFFRLNPHYLDLLFHPDFKCTNRHDDDIHGVWNSVFRAIEVLLIQNGMKPEEASYYSIWMWAGVHGMTGMLRDGLIGNPEHMCKYDDSSEAMCCPADELPKRVFPLVISMLGEALAKRKPS